MPIVVGQRAGSAMAAAARRGVHRPAIGSPTSGVRRRPHWQRRVLAANHVPATGFAQNSQTQEN